jgi:acyl-CoA synthetase (AMP-forming)/AMP-acid ligase II
VSFRGLIKPMFTRNGFNVYPRELERVIGEMPGVRTVRITAIPDPVRENDITVEVDGDVTAADVKAWCDDRLAVYKRPSVVTVSGGA